MLLVVGEAVGGGGGGSSGGGTARRPQPRRRRGGALAAHLGHVDEVPLRQLGWDLRPWLYLRQDALRQPSTVLVEHQGLTKGRLAKSRLAHETHISHGLALQGRATGHGLQGPEPQLWLTAFARRRALGGRARDLAQRRDVKLELVREHKVLAGRIARQAPRLEAVVGPIREDPLTCRKVRIQRFDPRIRHDAATVPCPSVARGAGDFHRLRQRLVGNVRHAVQLADHPNSAQKPEAGERQHGAAEDDPGQLPGGVDLACTLQSLPKLRPAAATVAAPEVRRARRHLRAEGRRREGALGGRGDHADGADAVQRVVGVLVVEFLEVVQQVPRGLL
mmetsp:Transcript_99798/g.321587  ORF Transcript_99798/g.321587 Transcript_99798/m.321587 type:complete len:334 (+) Transcript_99798:1-1002(+)